MPVWKEGAVIDRTLSSLNSIVAGLRRDVDALEKRPLCKGGSGGSPPPPPPPPTYGASYGWVWAVNKDTYKVHRLGNKEVSKVICDFPTGDDWIWPHWCVKGCLVIKTNNGYEVFDFYADRGSGNMPNPNNQPGTWYYGPSWVYEHNGQKLAVVGQYRYGSEGHVLLVDVRTGKQLAEMKGNSVSGRFFDVDPQNNSPMVTRETVNGDGFEFHLAEGTSFVKKWETVIPGMKGKTGYRTTGCYYNGIVHHNGSHGDPNIFHDWRSGQKLNLAHEITKDDNKSPLCNGFFWGGYGIGEGGVAFSAHGGSKTFPSFGRGFSTDDQHVPGHLYVIGAREEGECQLYTGTGYKVFDTKDIPGYDPSKWHVIVDSESCG